MLRYSHFVKKSMQAVQTWSNSNSMHVDVLHKTEQRFIAFLISYASCTRVWHINRYFVTNFHFGRKNVPCARCCATPISSRNRCKPYKPWSNSNSMHVDVLHKTEQRFIAFLISYASCTCVCDMSPLQARCCATPISSRNRFKPYKLDRIATACMLMCCIRQNSVLLLFW